MAVQYKHCAFLTAAFLLSGWVSIDSAVAQTTWPQWRGPTRDALVKPNQPWPASLQPEHLQQQWRLEVGPSYSGPIVSETTVFTTETHQARHEIVRAYDRTTGRQLWETQWEGSLSVPFFARANGDWIRSTPALDEKRLYVAGMRDVLVCLDSENGNVLWKVDFVDYFKSPLPAFGCVSSPLIVGNHLYIQAGAGLCKLDKHTGEIIWRTLQDGRGMYGSAFSSPYMAEVGGKQMLLAQTRQNLAGVDPESGQVFWSQEIPAFRGMNILTPVVFNDGVFTSAYGGLTTFFNVSQQAQSPAAEQAWTNRVTGYMSTPVVIDGHAYLHLRNQRLTCIDLRTGETKWTTRPFGKYWSMVSDGQKILALDERGELLLIEANREEFVVLDRRQISDADTWAHIAIVDGWIYIRELNALAAYRWTN